MSGFFKTFADNVLGKTPEHIHQQHEKTDGKCRHEQQQKAFKNKNIKSFRSHSRMQKFPTCKDTTSREKKKGQGHFLFRGDAYFLAKPQGTTIRKLMQKKTVCFTNHSASTHPLMYPKDCGPHPLHQNQQNQLFPENNLTLSHF